MYRTFMYTPLIVCFVLGVPQLLHPTSIFFTGVSVGFPPGPARFASSSTASWHAFLDWTYANVMLILRAPAKDYHYQAKCLKCSLPGEKALSTTKDHQTARRNALDTCVGWILASVGYLHRLDLVGHWVSRSLPSRMAATACFPTSTRRWSRS